MVVEAMGLSRVKFKYTGGNRGWRGDIPQVRFDITRLKNLGWQPEYTSDEAVRRAIRDILSKGELPTQAMMSKNQNHYTGDKRRRR